jgi:predicted secreted protein
MGSATGGDFVELRAGEEHLLRLPGLGTSGYRWVPKVEGGAEVVEVRSAGVGATESGELAGASADELFAIRANRAGEATVRFEQRRPWEAADAPSVDERTIRLRVT